VTPIYSGTTWLSLGGTALLLWLLLRL